MFISASVQSPNDPNTYEDVALIVVDPRPDVPNAERCRLALETLYARDERVRNGLYRTITLAPFSTRNPEHIALLRRGLAPGEDQMVLTPEQVTDLLSRD